MSRKNLKGEYSDLPLRTFKDIKLIQCVSSSLYLKLVELRCHRPYVVAHDVEYTKYKTRLHNTIELIYEGNVSIVLVKERYFR